eukprot:gene8665-612_t
MKKEVKKFFKLCHVDKTTRNFIKSPLIHSKKPDFLFQTNKMEEDTSINEEKSLKKEKKSDHVEMLKMFSNESFTYLLSVKKIFDIGDLKKVEEIFNEMIEKNIAPEQTQFMQLLIELIKSNNFTKIEELKKKYFSVSDFDKMNYTAFINALMVHKKYDKVEECYLEMFEKKIIPAIGQFNNFLKILVDEISLETAHNLALNLKSFTTVDEYSYSIIIQGYTNERNFTKVEEIFQEIYDLNLKCSLPLFNIFIKMLINSGKLDKALELFEQFKPRFSYGASTYVILIRGLLFSKSRSIFDKYEKMDDLVNEMIQKDFKPTSKHLTIFGKQLINLGELEKAKNLAFQFSDITDEKYFKNLVYAYLNSKQYEQVEKFIFESKEKTNQKPKTSIFTIFLQDYSNNNSIEETERIFKKFRNVIDYDHITFSQMIQIYMKSEKLDEINQLFNEIIDRNMEIIIFQFNYFLEKWLEKREIGPIENLLKKVENLDEYSYKILMKHYFELNEIEKLENLHKNLTKENLKNSLYRLILIKLIDLKKIKEINEETLKKVKRDDGSLNLKQFF